MADTRFVTMRLPAGLVDRVDAVAGPRGRTRFVVQALEQALDGVGPDQPTGGSSAEVPATAASLASRPAPARAPSSFAARAHVKPRPK